MSKPQAHEAFPHSQENVVTPVSTPDPETKAFVDEEITPPRKLWDPAALSWKSTVPLCVLLVFMGIALEGVLYVSNKNGGFVSVSARTTQVKQFLKSFVPAVLFIPVLTWLRKAYLEMKVVQPYLDLGRGEAAARDVMTAEYLTQGPTTTAKESFARRHLILSLASVVMLLSSVLQPFAGSLFTVQLSTRNSTVTIKTAGNLVYTPTPESYVPFVAAAGFLDSAIYNAGNLPPFVQTFGQPSTGYVVPAFDVGNGVNVTSAGWSAISTKTSLLYFETLCKPATSVTITSDATSGNFTLNASLSPACVENVTGGNPTDGKWHGVVGVADNACITDISPNATYPSDLPFSQSPVSFSFYANGTVASTIFCFAFQYEQTGTAQFNLTTDVLERVTGIESVSGSPFQTFSFNGLVTGDTSIYARGIQEAIGLTLADAVITNAQQNLGDLGIGGNFTQQNSDLGQNGVVLTRLVTNAYRNYVMLAASTVFTAVTGDTLTTGTLFVQHNRIYAYAPAVHVLAVLCVITGLALALVFSIHSKQRRGLHLADRPTTLGVVGALLSRSRVAELLDPRDTNEDIERKLAGLRFGIDPATGAIERTGRDQV